MTPSPSSIRGIILLWLVLLLPALASAAPRPYNFRLDPVYLNVYPDKVVIYPEVREIAPAELAVSNSYFGNLLQDIEVVRSVRYPLLILHPGSEKLLPVLRDLIRKHNLDLGVDVWEANRDFAPKELMQIYRNGQRIPPDMPDPDDAPDYLKPYRVELKQDQIILVDDNIVMASEELNTPGNPFEALVDRAEANGGNPYIVLIPYDHPLFQDLMKTIHKRAPTMVANLNALFEIQPPLTPIEVPHQDNQPLIIECRGNQLFAVSPEQLDQARASKYDELQKTANGNEAAFLKDAAAAELNVNGFRIDFSYALFGKYVLAAVRDATGYSFTDPLRETDETWLGSQLEKLTPDTRYIRFLVRPDSFDIFRLARKVVWDRGLESTCELLGEKDFIQIDGDPLSLPHFKEK